MRGVLGIKGFHQTQHWARLSDFGTDGTDDRARVTAR